MKSSLKKYRHKQQPVQPSGKPHSAYGTPSNDYKMNDQYAPYHMDGTESTLSYLEKTASSIDESKSAFKATLSNITKPTPDMLGYGGGSGSMSSISGSQSLYGSSNSSNNSNSNNSSLIAQQQQPVKPKPKPRPRGRKPATKVDPIPSSPVQSLPMNKGGLVDKPALISSNNIKDSNLKPSPIGGHWRMDETNAATAAASSAMGSYALAAEKNLTIPHTDVNTTYNHSNQTYQQYSSPHSSSSHSRIGSGTGSGSGSGSIPTHSQSKPESSSMYSSHGSVHHPYSSRTESTSTATTNSMLTATNAGAGMSANNPYSVHSMNSSVSQASPSLSSNHSYLNSPYESAKLATATTTTNSSGSHLLSTSHHQEQTTTAAVAAASLSQIDPLSLHAQHYSPYGK